MTRLFGYVGNNSNNYQTVAWNELTHITYGTIWCPSANSAAIQDAQGLNYSLMTSIQSEAKSVNPNIKFLATITGGNWQQSWEGGHLTAILANSTLRGQLATNLAAIVAQYNLDGIDIDWEGTDINNANYHAFLVALRAALPTGKLISVCMPPAINYQPATDYKYWLNPTTDSPLIDMFEVMSYGETWVNFQAYMQIWFSAGFPVAKMNAGYDSVSNDSLVDDITLIPEKVTWTVAQGIGGQMLWEADTAGAAVYLTTIFNTLNGVKMLPLAIVAYWDWTTAITNSVVAALPDIVISNTPGGYWNGNCVCSNFTPHGIHVYSYITGGYEGTEYKNTEDALASNLARIDAIALDGATGVFLDEVSSTLSAASKSYLTSIRNECLAKGLKLIINPGDSSFDTWLFGIADYVMTDEQYTGGSPSTSEKFSLAQCIVVGYSISMTSAQADQYSNAAIAAGFGHTYHCQNYDDLPSWWATYIAGITGSVPPPTGFTHGTSHTASFSVTVTTSGKACQVEIWLTPDGEIKSATTGLTAFTSTGVAQNMALPVTMPAAGTYQVNKDIYMNGVLIDFTQDTAIIVV